MKILATDMDMTLVPNGSHKYDDSLSLLSKIVKKNKICLIYVTGRNLNSCFKLINEHNLPIPDYIIAQVGTKIYKKVENDFKEDELWDTVIAKKSPHWDYEKVMADLLKIKGLALQEKDKINNFKISFYANGFANIKRIELEIRKFLKSHKDANLTVSIDYSLKRAYIDIMPKFVSKLAALNFIMSKQHFKSKDVIFAGDSGNDVPLLISKYKSIVVKNSHKYIKNIVSKTKKNKKQLYISKGLYGLNGNYSSGILEGMVHFGWISKEDITNNNN